MAARSGIGLDTVLRRYLAGYTLLGEFLAQEAQRGGLPHGVVPAQLVQGRSALFDRLIAAVSEEYEREATARIDSAEQRRAERVQRLLAGELFDAYDLAYDLDCNHLAAIAAGARAQDALRALGGELDARLLVVSPGEGTAWAWLGSRRGLDPAELLGELSTGWPPDTPLAFGEPGQGLDGWRLSHRQAAAALPIAQRGAERVVRYAEVALLASIVQDDLLLRSLRRFYLDPLEGDRDGGAAARRTLRAYFRSGRNTSSAAASLRVSRQAVAKRLRAAEERLGGPLDAYATELEIALRLDELGMAG